VTQPVPVKPLKPSAVLAFEDLWVATLPPLAETDSFVLGRSPDCDLVIDEETVSSHHARIEWMVEHAELEDLGSSNGTFVNGVKVSGHTRLVDSDAIDFGGVRVFFFSVSTLRQRMNQAPGASP
jgi:pSer/pThr/pTyr-binding forkhead associated (FHA) protein